MNVKRPLSLIVTAVLFGVSVSYAGGAVENSTEATKNAAASAGHASGSAAHSVAASAQVTSAASAVPLTVGASAGAVSGQTAKQSLRAASAKGEQPLEVSDETITVIPPDEALKAKQNVVKPNEVKADKAL